MIKMQNFIEKLIRKLLKIFWPSIQVIEEKNNDIKFEAEIISSPPKQKQKFAMNDGSPGFLEFVDSNTYKIEFLRSKT